MEEPFISFAEPENSVETSTNSNIQNIQSKPDREYLKNVIPGSLVDHVLYFIPQKLHHKFFDLLSLFIKNEISKDYLYYVEHIQFNANELIMDTPEEEMNICDDCRESMDIIQFPE
jgi:hypothetical protein